MSKDKKINLEDFLGGTKISSPLYREIIKTIVTKFKHESERQHKIRAMTMMYEKKYLTEMSLHAEAMQEVREKQSNRFAAEKEQDQRILLKIPETLWSRLDMVVFDPPFLKEDEEKDWFMKNFPRYVIPEEI
jgi:hypothetical protein